MWSVAGSGSSATPSNRSRTASRAALPSSPDERAAHQPPPEVVVHPPAHGDEAIDGVPGDEGLCRSLEPIGSVWRNPCTCTLNRPRRPSPSSHVRRRFVLSITAEELVGSLARERDGHMSRCEPAEREEAQRRKIGEGLVQVPDEILEVDGVVGERELELVVLGAQGVRDGTRVGELVLRAGFDEPDRERLHGLAHVACHQRDDQARVETTTEHRAQRHVAHQAEAH